MARIFIGSDHAGFELKEDVRRHLEAAGHEVTDVGTEDETSVDYPDYAEKVARAVASGQADRGVLVCGTGIGMAMTANKVDGVRAANITDPKMARMTRKHNDANVVTLAGRYTDPAVAREIVDVFLTTEYEGGRHQRRLDKMTELEKVNGRG